MTDKKNVLLQIQKVSDRRIEANHLKKFNHSLKYVHKLDEANKHKSECFEMHFISFGNRISYFPLWFKYI